MQETFFDPTTVPPHTIVVCGSRSWRDSIAIWKVLRGYQGATVVHGGARGADSLAGKVAEDLGFPVVREPADWRPGGVVDMGAGLKRNIRMLERHQPDLVIAFWDGKSNGTMHTVREARKRGIPVRVVSGP